MPRQALHPLIRRLETITSISADEKTAILDLPAKLVDLRADADIVREGDRPSQCCLLVEGFLSLLPFENGSSMSAAAMLMVV